MLSSRTNSNDTENDEEGESTMPGDYEQMPRIPSRNTPRPTAPPIRPSTSRSISQAKQRPSTNAPVPKPWPPVRSDTSPVRRRRRKRRPITPEIVIERQHHHRHRSSSGRDRVIQIPLDNRPTLGLRGPPKRVLEIERVRCCRRRKRRSSCYEIEYDDLPPAPQPLPVQSSFMYANPISNPYVLAAQPSLMAPANNSASWSTTFSQLTPEMINNLPRQTVHLPPIHLPGSIADENTELDTVIFPAEIVNPIDGTLSIIQADPSINNSRSAMVQSPFVVPASPPPPPLPPRIFNTPSNTQTPLEMLASASGPFMQQIHELFRRVALSQSQSIPPPYNPTMMQPSVPQYNPANIGPYNPMISAPVNATNTSPYPPANITPYQPTNNTQYNRPNTSGPYAPANITPYQPTNNTQYNRSNTSGPYAPANITPYRSANITPFQPTINNFTSSNPNNIGSSPGISLVPPRSSNIGPYSPANITPYNVRFNPSNSTSIPSVSNSYIPPSSLRSSDSLHSFSSDTNDRPLDTSHPSAQTPYQSNISMPKSILRNAPSNRPSNTTYARFNPSSVLPPNDVVRQMVTAV